VRPKTLDHVALWVSNRDEIAERVQPLGLHVIDRTDAFTLVGGDARRGKLTLFAADPPRDPGPLEHIALRVPEPGNERELDLGGGLRLRLIESSDGAVDLDHVALRVPDPEASARRWLDYGLAEAPSLDGGVARLEVSGAFVELHPGGVADMSERPLLNHLAVLVDSVEEHRSGAEERGIGIEELVDAPNTIALFVWGPDRVKLEYVEHKPSFSLT
jgi:catechol 2,3-dioxygenase-like lactoylglutathione lyase family enzyme